MAEVLEGVLDFLLTAAKMALGPTQHPSQWVSNAVSPGVKQLECETTDLDLVPRLRMSEAILPQSHTSSRRRA